MGGFADAIAGGGDDPVEKACWLYDNSYIGFLNRDNWNEANLLHVVCYGATIECEKKWMCEYDVRRMGREGRPQQLLIILENTSIFPLNVVGVSYVT